MTETEGGKEGRWQNRERKRIFLGLKKIRNSNPNQNHRALEVKFWAFKSATQHN